MAQGKISRLISQIGVGALNLFSRLPMRVHYGISDWIIYPLVRHVVRYRRAVVKRNLLLAFPEKSEHERLEIERRFYHFLSDLAVEIIKIHTMPAEELSRRVRWKNPEVVMQAFDEGHDFALCYLSHYLNWEWLIGIPLDMPEAGICQIYHPMRNKVFDRWFLDGRARFGAVNIAMKETLRRLLRLRQEMQQGEAHTDTQGFPVQGHPVRGYFFGSIADQLPKRENAHHSVTFLGRDTKVFTGSEQLGRKLGMSFFYARITRPERGRMEVSFERLDGVVDAEASEFAYTDEYMRRFEEDVRRHPEYWLWTHDRWKR